MLAPIPSTGSGTPSASVSAAPTSSSAGSFSDLLDALVQADVTDPASTPSVEVAVSCADDAAVLPEQSNPMLTAADPASPEVQETYDGQSASSISDQINTIAIPSTDSSLEGLSSSENADEARPTEEDDEKDEDLSNSVTLLSAIPVSVPTEAVRVAPATGGFSDSDVASADIARQPAAPPVNEILSIPAADADFVFAMPEDAVDSASSESRASSAPLAPTAEQNVSLDDESSVDQEFPTVLAAAERPKQAGADVPGAREPQSQQSAEQAELLKSVAQQTEKAPELPTAPTQDVAAEKQLTPQILAAENAVKQAQPARPDVEAIAAQLSERVKSSEVERGGVERTASKDRASVRQFESDLKAEVEGTGASSSPDTSSVPMQVGKPGEYSLQHDVPSQPVVTNSSVTARGQGQTEKSGHAFSEAVSSAAESPAQVAANSNWMSSVRLMERIHGSEMRVGIQSDFGDIAVRTAVNHNQLSAEISVQHAGLRDAIVAEIPSLQTRLSEQHIPITDVSVMTSTDSGSNGGSQAFQQAWHDNRPASQFSEVFGKESESGVDPANPVEGLERRAGLDIRI